MNPAIGRMKCPVCSAVGRSTVGTVHQEKRGKRAMYLRCPECGTIQPRMANGQAAMRQLIRPLETGSTPDPNPSDPGKTKPKAADPPQETKKPRRGLTGILKSLMEE